VADGGIRNALSDLAGALVPLSARGAQRDLEKRIDRIPNELNEYGFDPYGLDPNVLRHGALPSLLLYRYYFRVETHDIHRVPSGRVLLIANHAGQLPFDGMMLGMAMLLEAEPPRIVRAMGEYWIPRIPIFNVAATRGGFLVGTPENCIHMLLHGECVAVFPEGVRGMNKLFKDRYVLQRFGTGFMRLALETDTPIVPVGIVGSEEQNPGLANFDGVARALGIPALPVTWAFPWFGPLGMLPLPVKYHLYFGEPMRFEGDASDEDAVIEEKVEQVKGSIDAMLQRGLRERNGVFS
jgi:1-acyl-sn-glycerol-3-phosphate acyltransferase